jgi:hypothetical protein
MFGFESAEIVSRLDRSVWRRRSRLVRKENRKHSGMGPAFSTFVFPHSCNFSCAYFDFSIFVLFSTFKRARNGSREGGEVFSSSIHTTRSGETAWKPRMWSTSGRCRPRRRSESSERERCMEEERQRRYSEKRAQGRRTLSEGRHWRSTAWILRPWMPATLCNGTV